MESCDNPRECDVERVLRLLSTTQYICYRNKEGNCSDKEIKYLTPLNVLTLRDFSRFKLLQDFSLDP